MIQRAFRAARGLGGCLAACLILSMPAGARAGGAYNVTDTIELPKQLVVDVLAQRLQGVRIHVDNYGSRRRTGKDLSWHEDGSWVELPGGARRSFGVPEHQYKRRKKSTRKWKSYIRDLDSEALSVEAGQSGLLLRIRFESRGAELRTMCLRWKLFKKRWVECKAWGGPERDSQLDGARLEVRLRPAAYRGGIAYRPLEPGDVRFEADMKVSGKLCGKQKWLCRRIRKKAYPSVRKAVEAAVRASLNDEALRRRLAGWLKERIDLLVRQRFGIEGGWTVVGVRDLGDRFRVRVGWIAPLRPPKRVGEPPVGKDSVSIVSFRVERERAAIRCPGEVRFHVTVKAHRGKLRGEVFVEGKDARPYSKYLWKGKPRRWTMSKAGTASFTLTMPWNAEPTVPMRYVPSKAFVSVFLEDATRPGGKRYWTSAGPVYFRRACLPGPGGLGAAGGGPQTRPPRPPQLAPRPVPQRRPPPPPRPVPLQAPR